MCKSRDELFFVQQQLLLLTMEQMGDNKTKKMSRLEVDRITGSSLVEYGIQDSATPVRSGFGPA